MRPALRTLLRSPAFTVTAVPTIGLGVGANIAVFALLQQVVLDPLRYREPDRLVHIGQTHPGFPATQVSSPHFFDWERSATSFSGMAAHTFQAINEWRMRGDDGAMYEVSPTLANDAAAVLSIRRVRSFSSVTNRCIFRFEFPRYLSRNATILGFTLLRTGCIIPSDAV